MFALLRTYLRYAGRIEGDIEHAEAASVELQIQAASINTALPRRDDHLRGRDFFDVKTYPEILFRSEDLVSDLSILRPEHHPAVPRARQRNAELLLDRSGIAG